MDSGGELNSMTNLYLGVFTESNPQEPTIVKTDPRMPSQMVFEKDPELQAALCKPVIETTEATVLIDRATGIVQTYNLEGPPMPYDAAWSEIFLSRSPSNPYNRTMVSPLNYTTR